jgi:predicted TPR repeat methyltransferase
MTVSAQRRLLNQAEVHLQAGRLKRARTLYHQVLRQDQNCTEALFSLAIILHDGGELEAAAERLNQLLKLRPELAEAHFNLGTILNSLGQRESAIQAFERAIELQPTFADAHNNLGIAYREQGLLEQALGCFEKAVRYAPDSLAAMLNYGTALLKCQQLELAVEICRSAHVCHPESAEALYALGITLEHAGQSREALQHLREAVRLRPEVTEWQFHLAACEGSESPVAAPAEYVASLFDAYAARFDEHLVSRLGYRTPQHLGNAVQQLTNRHFKRALDLGCGTGLCGEVFKSIVECLIGVDLSSQMVSAARQRGIYHDLKVSDIGTFLANEVVGSDLVLAADVFIYIGDLGDTFSRVSKILRNDGVFAFSVEANSSDTWKLGSTRRYSHGLPYLQQLAKTHNFTEKSVNSVVLRTDAGKEVSGWIIVLEKLPG